MIRKLLATLLAVTATGAVAEERPAEVMLLGTYHLANNNRDLINLPIEDVLTARRQQELVRMVDGLARWRPTRIAIEWRRSDQAGLDKRYADYLAGTFTPTANEHYQIAFRLARKLGLTRIEAVDWNDAFPGAASDYDFLGWANRHGQGERLKRFVDEGQARANRTAAAMRTQTVSQWYRALNDPAERAASQRPYFTIASLGDNSQNPGAAWVGGWYGRNLRIFNNLRDVTRPGERLFILYGAGHTYLLDRFYRESGAGVLIDPRTVIPRH